MADSTAQLNPVPTNTASPATAPSSAHAASNLNFVQLDTAIRIVTPENIAFEYRLAGPFRRLSAYLFDMGIRVATCLGLWILFSLIFGFINLGGLGAGLTLIAWFVLEWFYGGLFEALWNGQTPGKRILGLRVLTTSGQPINGFQAVLRNFLRSADAMPFYCYQLGLLTAASNARFQRLGDLAAGTMVVVEERSRVYGVQRITEPAALQLAATLPANLTIGRSLARALSTYVERRGRFTWPARCEIAWHLSEPLRQKYNLPASTNPDVLLCALYHRAFIAEGHETAAASPFQAAPTPVRANPFGSAIRPPLPPIELVELSSPEVVG